MKTNAAVVPILPAIRLQRILYATDFSEASGKALPIVAAVARRYHAKVFIANVWSPLPYSMTAPEVVNILEKRQESEIRKEAEQLAQSPELSGLKKEIIVESGAPKEELARVVRDRGIDLAIISTHGRTGFKHLLMGSVAEELFRNLPCPVLTVGPLISSRFTGNRPIKEILFPTDFSEESKAIFPFLASLAEEDDARITILHVLPAETATNPELRRLSEPLRAQMEHLFAHEVCPRCKLDYVIDCGDPAQKILAYANYLKTDLIGFGVRGTLDIVTHLRNTAAYRVVMGAECPVLTYRWTSKW